MKSEIKTLATTVTWRSEYKTEQLDQVGALRLLDMHVQYNHPLPHVVQQAPQQHLGVGVSGRCKTENLSEEVIRDQLLSCCTD